MFYRFRSRKVLVPLLLVALLSIFLALCSCKRTAGQHVYLTWNQDDTSTSITVNFHSPERDALPRFVYYGTLPGGGTPGSYPFKSTMTGTYSEAGQRTVYSADLTQLTPNTAYYFVIGDESKAVAREDKFKTLPGDGESEIRFITGGDMGLASEVAALERMASLRDPMFALIGGDVVYDNGDPKNFWFWDDWLESWSKNMRRADGSLIPIVMAAGNHEVDGGYGGPAERAPFYRDFFFPGEKRSYFSRRFGGHTAIYVLDTDHIALVDGAQKDWLAADLSSDQDLANRFALYHVPLYPSVRSPDDSVTTRARHSWGPLFDQFQLTAAFENHDHALKRTHPLRAGIPATAGTIYIGDGCFGTKPREVAPGRDYIANSVGIRHFWSIRATPTQVRLDAFDIKGRLRDSTTINRSNSGGSAQQRLPNE